jgi:hypothetical protein
MGDSKDAATLAHPMVPGAVLAKDRGLDRAQLGLMAALGATCVLAIFAAQIFLALATAVYLARLALRRSSATRIAIAAPILAFVVWTLLSASFSPNPDESFRTGVKKLVLFFVIYVAHDTFLRRHARERVVDAVLLGSLALGMGMIIQYHFLGFDILNKRPTSFLGHWMTASGLLMCALVLAAARLTFGPISRALPCRKSRRALALLIGAFALLSLLQKTDIFAAEGERLFIAGLALAAAAMATSRGRWPDLSLSTGLAVLVVGVTIWALLVSQTRSAWLGALAGLAIVMILKAPKALWILVAGVVFVLAIRPEPVKQRLTVKDESSRDRYYMWQAGIDMILDQPIFGQGPGMIPFAYERFRWPEAPQNRTPHLHNNALQLAAERGLPCAVFWLWWVALSMGEAYRRARHGSAEDRWLAAGVLGAMSAFMIAGLFEYNFGDSEVLYVILLLSVAPFTLRKEAENPAS